MWPRRQLVFVATGILTALLGGYALAADAEPTGASPQTLTVWLIPLEPPVPQAAGGSQVEVFVFNQEFGAGRPVTVLNTTVDSLVDQLPAWNPEFDATNWEMVRGQVGTLQHLEQFAQEHSVSVRVRFVSWSAAFESLKRETQDPPDVAQVGSTWVANLAARGALRPFADNTSEQLQTRDVPGLSRASLRYTTDVRALFYWRRTPDLPAIAAPCTVSDGDWTAILASLAACNASGERRGRALVMPVGLTPNVLHDLVPLLWAGGAPFVTSGLGGSYADLTSDGALAVPLLLAKGATRDGQRLISFPEVTHQEAERYFLGGDYLAILSPATLLRRWHDAFAASQQQRPPSPAIEFMDIVGVAVPSVTFKGGSDLVTLKGSANAEMAAAFARFIVRDESQGDLLARLGHFPAQREDLGIDEFVATVAKGASEQATSLDSKLHEAIERGREYMPLAAWPAVMESRSTLEAVQAFWRRMADGAGGHVEQRLKAAGGVVEEAMNYHLNWLTRCWQVASSWGPVIAIPLFGLMLLLWHTDRRRRRAMEQAVRFRQFTSPALLMKGRVHEQLNKFGVKHLYSRGDGEDAAIVLAGLRGWRRAQESKSWQPAPLDVVVSTAFVMAMDSLCPHEILKEWRNQRPSDLQTFLASQGHLGRRGDGKACRFAIDELQFDCESTPRVAVPLMLEQALVCLFQNAIQAVVKQKTQRIVRVRYSRRDHALCIENPGTMPEALSRLLSLDPPQFADEAEQILQNARPDTPRPGIGLVEAYLIATLCYGGIEFRSDPGNVRVSVRLQPLRRGGRPWRRNNSTSSSSTIATATVE
jgi:ABC-type glycerol-3-phosphate transport system substrate-binding protein